MAEKTKKKSVGTTRALPAEVALRHRVPNPPPIFIGRSAELERLSAAIDRAPLTVLWGLGGLGKSALVSQLLGRHFAARLPTALLVAMRPGDSVDQLQVDVLRALATANGLHGASVDDASHDPHGVVATLIDLAERRRHIVVLEDLHHGDFDEVRSLLTTIARYARHSRWIIATRQDPGLSDIPEQIVALPAMPESDLRTLAVSIGGAATSDDLVSAARGSPWRMRQLAAGSRLDDEEDLFVHVSPVARHLLEQMVLLDHPFPLEVLARIAPLPEVDEIVLLERRGMIERSAGGLRLHDVTRAALAARPDAGADRSRVAEALEAAGDPAALIEAVRLHLAQNDLAGTERVLVARHAELSGAGYAPRLWDLLEAVTSEPLRGVRRHVAIAVGTAEALAWAIAQEAPDAIDERLVWVRALSLGANTGRTAEAAEDLVARARAAADEDVAFEATLLAARALYMGSRAAQAVVMLRSCVAKDAARAARRDALLARLLSTSGKDREALALVDDLEQRLDLPPLVRHEVQQQRAAVLFSAGRLRATSRVLAETASEISSSPRAVLRRMHLAIETGDLARGRELLESLRRFPTLLPLDRMHLLNMGGRLRLAAGELDEVDRNLDELLGMASLDRVTRGYHWARILRLLVANVLARPLPSLPWPENIPKPTGATAAWLAMFERVYALRRGRRATPPAELVEIVALHLLSHLTDAEEALHDGLHAAALEHAGAALELARDHGWVLHEADGVRMRAEILACMGRFDEVKDEARKLATLGERMPSPRYVAEARFLELLSASAPDVHALCSVARATSYAPEAGRRARRLLGLDAREDALDTLVLDAARKHWSASTIVHLASSEDPAVTSPAPWGIDLVAREVHIGSGDPVSMRRHAVLLHVLEVCASSEEPVSREELAREVWKVTDYHPHRHDARIQMAVSRLRRLVDPDGTQERVVTVGEGYALRRPLWLLTASR